MDWSIFWTAFGAIGGAVGAIGGVTGIVALFQTREANQLMKDANDTAEEANRVAAESLKTAQTANQLAGHANQIGEQANLIAQRALTAGLDQTVYHWTAQYDAEGSVLRVVNDCGLDARDVHVIVHHEGEVVAEGHAALISAVGVLELDAPLMLDELRKDARGYGDGFYGTPRVKVSISVTWVSEFGVHRSLESEQGFGYTKRTKILS
ncbi:hypothetical protein BSD967_11390 [Bifidobacterium saguini]|uniref:Lipoprotein n=1 Tax=Bifidobacterium saguini TaxID=762210 RepID=A0ABX7SCF3_9BIFI|nr:hypothetical protein [Bifidobacterium saguini]QTB90804.1 hypothetical protein BSD967_11055 [Bifidobacterium saguini]QTB90866.1 hypothetical protein BSD967_11390 [Bifidobacterium saguini]